MSLTTIVGLEIVSTYSTRAGLAARAASTAARSVASMNVVDTPSRPNWLTSRERVEP